MSEPRHQAPGGWRRVVIGLLLGAGLGSLYLRFLPSDERDPRP